MFKLSMTYICIIKCYLITKRMHLVLRINTKQFLWHIVKCWVRCRVASIIKLPICLKAYIYTFVHVLRKLFEKKVLSGVFLAVKLYCFWKWEWDRKKEDVGRQNEI